MRSVASQSTDPIVAHRRRMRRAHRRYLVVLGLSGLLIAGFVAVVTSRGEQAHTHSHPATRAAVEVRLQPPAPAVTLTWRSADHTALGSPLQGGVVVTYAGYTVTGRDASSGTALWTFSRTDRTLCSVTRIGNRAMALYRHAGNCDEVNALNATTGRQVWTRTLFENGLALNGSANILVEGDTLFIWNAAALFALQIDDQPCRAASPQGCGYEYFSYPPATQCRLGSVAAGTGGVLVGEQCGDGPHLLLRNRTLGANGSDQKVVWTTPVLAAPEVAVQADENMAAIVPSTGTIQNLNPTNGKPTTAVPVPGGAIAAPIAASIVSNVLLVHAPGRTYALDTGALIWSAATMALPASIGDQMLTTPTLAGLATLSAGTGRVVKRWTLMPVPDANAQIVRFGTGFLSAGTSTAVYG